MEREEERERRRLRDRQRRQSMTKEQRERHLARRRRNYQLRRQRAANAQLLSLPLPQPTSSEALATTSAHPQWLTPFTPSHHTLFHPQHQTLQIHQGSSIQLEGFPRRLRLSNIKQLARNLGNSMSVPLDNQIVPAEFIPASSANHGNSGTTKPLRLNCVKRIARSLSFASETTTPQK
ncbi:unnamed protein product [Sphenostylis stenocarpa]|uniref:Uncharacterized protein n=1 Tax=Sphenostylis stenocarpa TaxID=92480 RepID=A0AA86SIK8_9FABA|nr:unnamed protein product [Sphenostylis stenocarpa]